MNMRKYAKPMLILLVFCFAHTSGCRKVTFAEDSSPIYECTWGTDENMRDWGGHPQGLWGRTVKSEELLIWDWKGLELLRREPMRLQKETYAETVFSKENWFIAAEPKVERMLAIRDLADQKLIEKYPYNNDWYPSVIGMATDRSLVAVLLAENTDKNRDYDKPKCRIILVDAAQKTFQEVMSVVGKSSSYSAASIRRIIVSPNGRYIAFAAWGQRVGLIDVEQKHVREVPSGIMGLYYLAFSPDSKILYAGGTKGCVYGIDVLTGKVQSRWFASDSGQAEYGHRISELAASPDGRFVAAGTGPEGYVYVFSTQDGKLVSRLNHGGSTILTLSFSPDSQALATMAAGMIKVWKMPDINPPAAQPSKSANVEAKVEEADSETVDPNRPASP